MTYQNYQEKTELLKKLITREITGTPTELAAKLRVSERTARRMVEYLRLEDEIIYCRRAKTYRYKD